MEISPQTNQVGYQEKNSFTDITFAVITAYRITSLKNCLESIRSCGGKNLIVVRPDDDREAIEATQDYFPAAIQLSVRQGPSAARESAARVASTRYILFLDDDLVINSNAVLEMKGFLEGKSEFDIVSVCWKEFDRFRPIGSLFRDIHTDQGQVVITTPLERDKVLHLEWAEVDVPLAGMLCRADIFKRVNFDPNYKFYFELFDFFLQCREEGIRSAVLIRPFFTHKPVSYTRSTFRHSKIIDGGKQYLESKWGIKALTSHVSSFNDLSLSGRVKRYIRGTGRHK